MVSDIEIDSLELLLEYSISLNDLKSWQLLIDVNWNTYLLLFTTVNVVITTIQNMTI